MWEKIKKSTVTHMILLFLAVWVAGGAVKMLYQTVLLSREDEAGREKIKELEAKKRELETRIEELETLEARQKEAKERLNLKLPGEEVVVVVPAKPQEKKPENSSSFLGRLWESVKGVF